ncbi:MAG TPA: hypothetical protein VKC90_02505 [Chitinophagaceae bacterium]|nr:hypothetical protein [Chitinophagaceae bacterium]
MYWPVRNTKSKTVANVYAIKYDGTMVIVKSNETIQLLINECSINGVAAKQTSKYIPVKLRFNIAYKCIKIRNEKKNRYG